MPLVTTPSGSLRGVALEGADAYLGIRFTPHAASMAFGLSYVSQLTTLMKYLHRPTLVVLGLTLGLSFLLGGCNTARGVGKDVERAGEHIQDATK